MKIYQKLFMKDGKVKGGDICNSTNKTSGTELKEGIEAIWCLFCLVVKLFLILL